MGISASGGRRFSIVARERVEGSGLALARGLLPERAGFKAAGAKLRATLFALTRFGAALISRLGI